MADKKKGVAKPKIKKLTKSQATLLDNVVSDAETEFKQIMSMLQNHSNKLLMPVINMHIGNFREELGVPEEWKYDDAKRYFREVPKKD